MNIYTINIHKCAINISFQDIIIITDYDNYYSAMEIINNTFMVINYLQFPSKNLNHTYLHNIKVHNNDSHYYYHSCEETCSLLIG